MYVAFLVASKAFDRVNHTKPVSKLLRLGVPTWIIKVLVQWYCNQSMYVRWGTVSPKILKETVEQISAPLAAHVFNMSLQERIVPFEWKEANIIPLFKKGSRNKSVNYRPVSLTSVIWKLLETIIRDHRYI